MPVELVKLPDVGEGVAEAEIVEWHVAVGETVREDQILAAVMTDKATVEIPSPWAGVVVEIGGELGARLAVGSPLVGIRLGADDGGAGRETCDVAQRDHRAASREAQVDVRVASSGEADGQHDSRSNTSHRNGAAGAAATLAPVRPIASPAIRARAREAGIDLRQVSGTGAAGRITHDDLAGYVRNRSNGTAGPRIAQRNDAVEQIKVVGLRRRIAERMAESTRRVAHFSYVEEVDVTALDELRKQLNAKFADSRPRLTVLPFVVAALVHAVRDFPQVNATYDDDKEVVSRHGAVHVGIATQTSSGLMVPVLFHAEALDLWASAAGIKRLAEAVRQGRARPEELTGSTITISSLGDLGGIATTPVINRPELAIIGVNRMAIRPAWQHGQFVPRMMMNLSSSFDHRIIDGYEAAQFIRCIKELLEAPALLLIGN